MDLVTGATGHIGNVLVRQLLARGRSVRVLVRPSSPAPALAGLAVEVSPGDILDPQSVQRAMQGVQVVYHLAARITFDPADDLLAQRVNLEGTRHVIEAACQAGIERLVYTSSIYALRLPDQGLVDEACPFDPESARGGYDRSKATASLEVLDATGRIDAVVALPTAVTGPFDYQRSETGRGICYNLPSGIKFTVDGAYDFVDVRDVARGLIAAAELGRRGRTYILGGERLTVHQVARIIWDAAGGWHVGIRLPDWVADLAADFLPYFSEHPIVTPYALGAIRSNSHISHARAAQELGYQPRPAAEAITAAVRWWQAEREHPQTLPEPFTASPA